MQIFPLLGHLQVQKIIGVKNLATNESLKWTFHYL